MREHWTTHIDGMFAFALTMPEPAEASAANLASWPLRPCATDEQAQQWRAQARDAFALVAELRLQGLDDMAAEVADWYAARLRGLSRREKRDRITREYLAAQERAKRRRERSAVARVERRKRNAEYNAYVADKARAARARERAEAAERRAAREARRRVPVAS